MATSAELLLDTSAAVSLLDTSALRHDAVWDRTRGRVLGLAGHAAAETFSVITRMRGRISPEAAARSIGATFPASHSLSAAAAGTVLARCAAAGIGGGAVYDALVALAAEEAGVTLLSLDRRAVRTYAAFDVTVEFL